MMQYEVVERRRWLTSEEFLDLVSATNFIPGPNSTELAIHIGHRRAGFRGLVVAGAFFIVPAVAMTMAIAYVYVRFGQLPQAAAVLYGIKPIIIAVIVQALWSLGRTAVKSKGLGLLGVAAAVANAVGGNEIAVLFGAGLVWCAIARKRSPRGGGDGGDAPSANMALVGLPSVGAAAVASGVSSSGIFFVFLKIGSVLFGSGYVLLAFLRSELVQSRHWLTEAQLIDAVAAGQMTPGPVFSTATFIGYMLSGWRGALAATLGIFLPAFVFVAISGPLVPRLRRWAAAGRFLDGLNVASLSLMAVVALSLARAALVDVWTVALAVGSGVLLIRLKVNSVWLIVGGALLGYLIRTFAPA